MCSPASTSPAQTRKPAPPVTGPVRGGRAHRRSATQRTHRPARRTNEPWAANQREGRARTARDRVKPRCAVRPLPSQLCTQRPTIPNESNEPRENNPTHRAVRGICGGPALTREVGVREERAVGGQPAAAGVLGRRPVHGHHQPGVGDCDGRGRPQRERLHARPYFETVHAARSRGREIERGEGGAVAQPQCALTRLT